MEEIFATKIKINDVLNIKDFEIPLSETERRYLIITGKNGSGKTTVLINIKNYINSLTSYGDYETLIERNDIELKLLNNLYEQKAYILNQPNASEDKARDIDKRIKSQLNSLFKFGGAQTYFNIPNLISKEF